MCIYISVLIKTVPVMSMVASGRTYIVLLVQHIVFSTNNSYIQIIVTYSIVYGRKSKVQKCGAIGTETLKV